jgi:hypothetical protein
LEAFRWTGGSVQGAGRESFGESFRDVRLRSRKDSFVTLTGDYRDLDLVAGWSPENPEVRSWLVVQASYGNGFLDRLEHRQQYKADARDLSDGTPTPEAPRLIVDALATFDRLPFRLRARSEFEYVGAKPLGDGFVGVPTTEVRGAVLRSFKQGRMDLGTNFLIAYGYTGQTTEVLALPDDAVPFERIVGVRLPSYFSISYTYRFQSRLPH